MKIRKYKSYDQYVRVQSEANKKKIKNVWVAENTIKQIYGFIGAKEKIKILCHGTRNGKEQKLFRKFYPDCEIIGTEISDTATRFPDTIQWDFHEIKSGWEGFFDLIYSNSLDHSYKPSKALNAWLSCLKPSGHLALEWTGQNERNTWNDPFSATLEELRGLIIGKKVGARIIHEIDIPTKSQKRKYQKVLFIQR